MERLKELRTRIVGTYPFGGPSREAVNDDKIDWAVPHETYTPPYFTTEKVLRSNQADPEDLNKRNIKFNKIDGDVNRQSHMGDYQLDDKGVPLNPVGRTGLRGRGNLYRWGPNHAADPVVTRWKDFLNPGQIGGTRILQFVAIQRRDNGEWAIPGGMIDPGEQAIQALKREFLEEVFSIDGATDAEKKDLQDVFEELFRDGTDIYKGYVDDPRNTDNSWIETVCKNFHCDDPKILNLPLKAGDDAKNAEWVDISADLKLYASHTRLIEKVAKLHNASW